MVVSKLTWSPRDQGRRRCAGSYRRYNRACVLLLRDGGRTGSASRCSPDLRAGPVLALAVSLGQDARSRIWELGGGGRSAPAGRDARNFHRRDLAGRPKGQRLGGEVTVEGRPCKGVAVVAAQRDHVRSFSRFPKRATIGSWLTRWRAECWLRSGTDLTGEVRLGFRQPDAGPVRSPPGFHRGGHEVGYAPEPSRPEAAGPPRWEPPPPPFRYTTGGPGQRA